jgi:hypothetical protein
LKNYPPGPKINLHLTRYGGMVIDYLFAMDFFWTFHFYI